MKMIMLMTLMLVAATSIYAANKPQTTCPAMEGQAVNPKLYVDSDGYRIYVCCRQCVKAVKADPAKYIAKLKAEGVELEKAPQK
ncbi:MAG: hypothetical protein WCH86_02760 [Kiritimatiellales bacterium]